MGAAAPAREKSLFQIVTKVKVAAAGAERAMRPDPAEGDLVAVGGVGDAVLLIDIDDRRHAIFPLRFPGRRCSNRSLKMLKSKFEDAHRLSTTFFIGINGLTVKMLKCSSIRDLSIFTVVTRFPPTPFG